MGLKAPKGTKLRLCFFVGSMQQTPKDFFWEEDDFVIDEEICILESEVLDDEVTVGCVILQNLTDFPESIVIDFFLQIDFLDSKF